MLAKNLHALSACGRIFVEEIFRFQRQRALLTGVDGVRVAAISFPQRFGGSIHPNVHYHVVVPDAFFCRDTAGVVRHELLPKPSRSELAPGKLASADGDGSERRRRAFASLSSAFACRGTDRHESRDQLAGRDAQGRRSSPPLRTGAPVEGLDADTGPLPPGEYIRLAVTDTGAGMSEEVLARAFGSFLSTRRPGLGTGLGLSTVHGMVIRTGRGICVESAPGEGTTHGDEVHGFQDPLAALAAVQKGTITPEMLITDVVMPKMNGHMLGNKISEETSEVQPFCRCQVTRMEFSSREG